VIQAASLEIVSPGKKSQEEEGNEQVQKPEENQQ
jgi:hypothetical protein